jgi:translation initiation factor 3 subunit C
MELISELREISKQYQLGPAMDIKILFNQISVNLDYNTRVNKCMKSESWNECLRMLEEIVDTLIKNENIELSDSVADDEENFGDKSKPLRIKGCVLTMNDRMIEEYVKLLQQCDAHGSGYVDRLKDEPKIAALIDRIQGYLEKKPAEEVNKQELCRIYLKKVENIYYKYDKNNDKNSAELVDRLCKFIYTYDSTNRLRTLAMLCHIYHNALHDRWFEARDLMLMSHLQESIDSADIPLQILYNRTMVQVGLCAFRVGNIKESHSALLDIQAGNRAKELLAQGLVMQRNVEKTKEQEVRERQRLIPFHMHINLELIECIYLVAAMLIEIPYMCSRDYETKKRMISKQFHYQLKFSERQPVVGPPENMREHVVAASRAMRNGDWRACINYLINEKMNAKVWDLMPQSTNVKSMLAEKVKEESLRSYLFRYSSVYESISIESLAQMFELPRTQVYSIISKMIINEELMVSLAFKSIWLLLHTRKFFFLLRPHWTSPHKQLSCIVLTLRSYKC